jgi:predicted phage terminase large subunit-like protein
MVSVTIVVMQRLHIEDVSGLFLERDNVRHICLPAELSDNVFPESAKKIYKDGLLDPRRLSKSALNEFKTNLGSYGYAGQYMQIPAPDGGGIWDSDWFQAIPDEKFPSLEQMTSYGTDWDLAYTKKEENSASAFVVAGKIGENIYIDRVGSEWLEFPELIALMRSKPAPHYIEAKASGKSAKQTLTYEGINAIEIEVIGSGDKIARARLSSPTAEAGRIFIRASQKDYLTNDSKQGIKFFPNGSHNDLADALSQSIMRLSKTYKAIIL